MTKKTGTTKTTESSRRGRPARSSDVVQLSTTIDAEIAAKIDEIVKQNGFTKSFVVNKALRDYIDGESWRFLHALKNNLDAFLQK